MISWDDFWLEILPTISVVPEFWEYLGSYKFEDEGVFLESS